MCICYCECYVNSALFHSMLYTRACCISSACNDAFLNNVNIIWKPKDLRKLPETLHYCLISKLYVFSKETKLSTIRKLHVLFPELESYPVRLE